jgi:hypothetical protein
MILGALDEAGGQEYLTRQAEKNPTAFMTLLGKVLPTQLAGTPEQPIRFLERAGGADYPRGIRAAAGG